MRYLILIVLIASGCGVDLKSGDNSFNQETTSSTTSTTNNTNTNVAGSSSSMCTEVRFPDGKNGNLWKPVSEGDGKLVILFAANFTEVFNSVCVVVAATNTEECGSFIDFTNGERQTWRYNLAGSEYTGLIKIEEASGLVCEVTISTPAERVD